MYNKRKEKKHLKRNKTSTNEIIIVVGYLLQFSTPHRAAQAQFILINVERRFDIQMCAINDFLYEKTTTSQYFEKYVLFIHFENNLG